SVSQPGITDSPEGNFMDLVIAGVNQLQSQITSRKTLKSLEQKFWDGWWPTGVAVGYLNAGDPSDDKKRIIIVDEERAPLVQEAFNMYVTGDYSVYEVRDALYKKGFRTHAGKRLAHSKMIEVLKNQFYYGEMRWRGLVHTGKHKPLIDKETWERVQLVMAEHNRYACRRQKFNFILRGLTYCANCGQRYTAEHHPKKNKSYYHCNRSGDQIKCHDKYVEVWDLEQQIADLFKYIEFTPSFKERLVARIEKIYGSRKEVINKEKRSLNTQKMLLEKKRDVAEEKLFASLITDDDFTRVKVKIKEQVEAIQDEIYKQDKKLNMRIDELQDVLLFARNAYEAFVKAPAELQRLFLGLYWDRFEVTDKKVVTVLPTPIIRGLMLAEDMVFTKKYQEIREPRIITNMAVEFTPVVAGKSKSKLAPKTQKSRRNAEIPVMVSNQP
ncbi:MAG: recombinase family protein, partial [bacterium]|nr:recombinase family protein [bacterium]